MITRKLLNRFHVGFIAVIVLLWVYTHCPDIFSDSSVQATKYQYSLDSIDRKEKEFLEFEELKKDTSLRKFFIEDNDENRLSIHKLQLRLKEEQLIRLKTTLQFIYYLAYFYVLYTIISLYLYRIAKN